MNFEKRHECWFLIGLEDRGLATKFTITMMTNIYSIAVIWFQKVEGVFIREGVCTNNMVLQFFFARLDLQQSLSNGKFELLLAQTIVYMSQFYISLTLTFLYMF